MKRLLKVFTKDDWKKKDKKALKDIPEIDVDKMLKKNAELLTIKGGK